jgi:hypothetical protein
MLLISSEIIKTCEELKVRIKERFPNARLNDTCQKLLTIANEADKTNEWIRKPNIFIRISSWFCIIVLALFIIPAGMKFVEVTKLNLGDFFQMLDSSFNILILAGVSGFYLMSAELRQKRKKVVSSLNKLKCLTHIIDAHQLTKDPNLIVERRTEHSPKREMTDYELGRYLDYCSEMLSLISKIAFLYVQNFNDTVANDLVNDLESLTNGFSQRIWQKIVLLEK